MRILKLKKIIFHHKSPILVKDVDIEKILVSTKISSVEKKCKCFIGYLYNDNKVKSLHIMLPKTSINVKSYDGQVNGCIFWLEKMTY